MTYPRRRTGKPIESVELRISFKADRDTAKRIKELLPSALLLKGSCELTITASSPSDVARQARDAMDKVREIVVPPKGLK